MLLPVEDFGEAALEVAVQLLGLQSDDLDGTADHGVVAGLVVASQEGHLLDDLEQQLEHVDAVEKTLQSLALVEEAGLGTGVLVAGDAAPDDEAVQRAQ